MSRTLRGTDWGLAGAADWHDRTPWRRSTIPFERWRAGDYTPDEAYWAGFYTCAENALRAAGFDAVRCVRAWHAALEGQL